MTARPRLLFISPRFLFPTDEGGKIRTSNILRGLKGGAFHITLASPAPMNAARFQSDIDGVCDAFIAWPAAPASRWRRLAALAARVPVSVATDRSAAGRAVIAQALAAGTDLVVTDFPHAAVLLPSHIRAASVLFTHNLEAEIYERHAKVAKDFWKPVWQNQARKMARFEGAVCRRHDCVIAVSARDAAALRKRYGVETREIVTGVDLDFFAATPQRAVADGGGTVVFTGVMDSPANIDGVLFLLREIWPLVLKQRPQARLVIVGRNPPEQILALTRNEALRASATGFVDDIRPHVAAADVAVIPLRVGGGTRIKAFEAIAMYRPVVSTAIGIEGLDLVPGSHFLQADAAEPFARAVLSLLDDAAQRKRLADAGRALLEDRFTWAQVARQFEAICLDALKSGPRKS